MAIVNALRFDDFSGAVISDEETWLLRNRKSYICDNIHSVLSPEMSNDWNMEVVYGGINHPEFHGEVLEKTLKQLKESSSPYKTVESVAKKTLQCMQECSKRRVNDRLYYLFGFTLDDFNRGYFESGGEKYDIKDEKIKKMALDVIQDKEKMPMMMGYPKKHALIAGYDKRDGFSMFCLKAEVSVLSFVSGGFEALGTGRYASGIVFGDYIRRKNVSERRKGYERVEGMVALIESAISAAENFNEVGGYFNIAYINGEGKTHKERYQEIFHHRARLATEIVLAYRNSLLKRKATYDLIDRLIYQGETEEEVEDKLFTQATNPGALELVVRGYKVADPEAVNRSVSPFLTLKSNNISKTSEKPCNM